MASVIVNTTCTQLMKVFGFVHCTMLTWIKNPFEAIEATGW